MNNEGLLNVVMFSHIFMSDILMNDPFVHM